MTLQKNRLSVVIGSGGVLCAASLGLSKALRREGLIPGMAVGCSGGSIYAAIIALGYLFVMDDFSVEYVAGHSNRDLPTYFKISAIWGGQEGSLLFWGWLLTIYSALVVIQNRRKHRATTGRSVIDSGDTKADLALSEEMRIWCDCGDMDQVGLLRLESTNCIGQSS